MFIKSDTVAVCNVVPVRYRNEHCLIELEWLDCFLLRERLKSIETSGMTIKLPFLFFALMNMTAAAASAPLLLIPLSMPMRSKRRLAQSAMIIITGYVMTRA